MRGNNSAPEPKGTETDQLQPEKKSSFLDFLQQAPISGFPVTVFGLLIMAAICIVFFVINPIIGLCILGGMVCSVATLQIFRDNNPAKTKMDPLFFADTDSISSQLPMPKNLPMPYAVLNLRGHILTQNEAFAAAFPTAEDAAGVIEPLLKGGIGEGKDTFLDYKGRTYEAHIVPCDFLDPSGAKGSVLTLALVDMTTAKKWKQEREDLETVVGMIFLDNYDDVQDSLENAQLPILTSLVEQKLNSFASEYDGLIRRLEKDRYLFLLPKGKLEELKEKKFEILSEIKEISVGDHIPMTMSIGLGIGHGSLDLSAKNSKAAIDLALGRGGDQALIKDGEKFLFYGGKSGEISRNARVRARVKADALLELLGDASDVLVMGHVNPDLDSLGSCIGLCAIAKTAGKPCRIVLDRPGQAIRRLFERMEEAGETDIFITPEDAVDAMTSQTLVMIADTHRPSIVASQDVLEHAKKLVLIDHHRRSTDFIEQAVLIYHEPYASSTAELVTEMIRHMSGRITLRPLEADALLAGITVDTKNFCVNTGAVTFESAAFLRRHGADSFRVRRLFQNDMEVYRAKAATIQGTEIYGGNMAISVCPTTSENSLLTAAQAADELMNVTGIKASFVCCQVDHVIHISARSFGDVNVQVIMESLGGGGHLTVSGAQLTNCTLEEAIEKIKHAIDAYREVETP